MTAYMWDFGRHAYDLVELPEGCSTYRDDFDELVTCPGCGGRLRFADTYTSRRFHDRVGFGYGVCEKCHDQEMKDEYDAMFGGGR